MTKREKWTVPQMALELSLDPRTLSKKIQENDVVSLNPTERVKKYYFGEVIRQVFIDKAKKTISEVRLEREEIALKQDRRNDQLAEAEVVKRKDMEDAWEKYIINCKTRLLSIPSELAPQAVGLKEKEIKDVAMSLIRNAIMELKENDNSGSSKITGKHQTRKQRVDTSKGN
jgi:hypothetical protein